MIGTSFGRYQVIESLGRGGMGEVHLAEDPALGRKVAIKVLPAEFRDDLDRRQRLLHEARAASALNHPNIVVIYDIGEADASLFVAMEVVDGETLREWSQSKKRAPRDVMTIARQATAALAVAHEAGLVHRDLKPENLMVRRDGLLKILDFGLARSVSPEMGDRTATMPGTLMGTIPYMSPEQVLGQPAGPASDLFALGTILYELLTGRHPFEGENAIDTMHRILHETPEPASRVNPDLSGDFDFVLAKLLAKDSHRRHASARDLDVDLETLECGCGPAATIRSTEDAAPRALAVLPFKNIGGDPSLHYLGMGFADAVITRLSASPDLIVRATGTVARYLDQPVDPRVVAQEVQADIVLDASFQRAGDRLRATARLVEAASGRSLWADKIDVRFEDIFDVQDQVAKGIAEALTARLTVRPPSSTSRAAARFVPSPDAYQRFMRGVDFYRHASEEGFLASIAELEAAVRLQPDYALAWAYLGFSYHALVDGGFRPEPSWYEKAAAALERAVALDPDDAMVRHLSAAQHIVHGRKRETYRDLVAAIARAPHFWANYHYVGYLFRLSDMIEEMLLANERAIELDPNLPWAYGGMTRGLQLLGRHEEAQSWIDRYVQRTGQRDRSHGLVMRGLAYQGKFEELLDGFLSGRLSGGPSRDGDYYLAVASLRRGDREQARVHMMRFEPMASIDMDAAGYAASYYAHAGDSDRAFRYLERAIELGLDTLRFYENPHLFGPLHSHPGWSLFIAGVRERVAQWRSEFRWPLPSG
jgi:TolB-like protein/Tfp pilus assembly protein PilF/predicted Ser/Thr protein kinase